MKRQLYKVLSVILILSFCIFPQMEGQAASTEKFVKTINVTAKKYGAKKGKDSTKAIQMALDEAAKLGTKKKRAKVVIPNGTYYIDRTLKIGSNTYLECGSKTKILKKSKNCLFMLRGQSTGKVGGTKDLSNITIKGGIWDARYIKRNDVSGGALFYFTHINNLEILDLTLRNCYGSHLIEVGAADTVRISGCNLYGYKKVSSWGEKEAIQLDLPHNSDIEPDAAPYDDTPCSNVVIENNKIHDYGRGIGSHSAVKNVYHKNITIRKNKIYNMAAEAIYINNYINLNITKNTITNVSSGVVIKGFDSKLATMFTKPRKGAVITKLTNNDYNINITNNKITTKNAISKDASEYGIYIAGNKNFPLNGFLIKNNTISSASNGMNLRYMNNSKIINNTISRRNNTSSSSYVVDAIALSNASSNLIDSNKFSASTTKRFDNIISIRNYSKKNTVINTVAQNAKVNGINVTENSSLTLTNSSILNSGKNGIAVMSKSSAVINATAVSGSGGNGIFIYKSASANIKNDSYVKQSKENGVTVSDSSSAVLNKCSIENSGTYGIFVYNNSKADVKVGKVNNSKKSGINVNKGSIDVANTTVSNSTEHGIVLNGSSTGNVDNNVVDSNGGTGIYINGSKPSNITANTVKNNKSRGIDITNKSSVNMVKDNALSNPSAAIELRVYNSTVPSNLGNLQRGKTEIDSYNNHIL